MENRNAPAFPVEVSFQEDGLMVGLQTGNNSGMAKGLTKREHFAGLAMQGMLANPLVDKMMREEKKRIAEVAIEHADELLTQLNK